MLTGLDIYSPQTGIPVLANSTLGIFNDLIQIRNVKGFEPVTASINTTPYANIVGEFFTGKSVGKRNIVITLGLNPNYDDWTIDGLRRLLYRYFMPGELVILKISDSILPKTAISGYVENVDPNIFAKDPEVQLSIICPDPEFVQDEPVIVDGVVGSSSSYIELEYLGNVSTGFVVRVDSSVAVPDYSGRLRIINQVTDLEMFDTTVIVDEDASFEMSSIIGEKYSRSVTVPGNVATNLLQNVADLSQWPRLYPGTNRFLVTCDPGSEGQTFKLVYANRFGAL